MREQARLTEPQLESMLTRLAAGKWASERKMRLLAAACCRSLSDWLASPEQQEVVEVIERFAEGAASKAALKRGRRAIRAVRHALPESGGADWRACWIVEVAASENAYTMTCHELILHAHLFLEEAVRMRAYVAELLGEFIADPFRSPPVPRALFDWQGCTIGTLAVGA